MLKVFINSRFEHDSIFSEKNSCKTLDLVLFFSGYCDDDDDDDEI